MANKIYLASPLGFSPETRSYLHKVKQRLIEQGFSIFDPWEQNKCDNEIEAALANDSFKERVAQFKSIASSIGACNENGIIQADIVFAILDGPEVDSGTASEIGFGSAQGKKCFGLRTDLRDTGDFVGSPVNIQVLHFIERTGGKLFRSIEEIVLT